MVSVVNFINKIESENAEQQSELDEIQEDLMIDENEFSLVNFGAAIGKHSPQHEEIKTNRSRANFTITTLDGELSGVGLVEGNKVVPLQLTKQNT